LPYDTAAGIAAAGKPLTQKVVISLKDNAPVLRLEGITKLYPGVVALENVTIGFLPGEVHAIVGENGAGKSTMIKVIAGAIKPTSGAISCGGNTYEAMTPALSRSLGIEVVYQEFNLIDPLSAAENICLGEKYGRLVNRRKINQIAKDIFDQFDVDISPSALVRDLPSAQQQIVEIAKAVSKDARILILDEPTAPLTLKETDALFRIVALLKARGVTIIYISHRMDEIFRIADRVSVLRDGQYVTTVNVKDTCRQELIELMVGRELSDSYPKRDFEPGPESLRVGRITTEVVSDVSFSAKRGEILGVSGLVGSGRTEIMRAIFGADKRKRGDIFIDGKQVQINSPRDAIRHGIGLIPEDRKRQGVFLNFTIMWNTAIVNIKNLSRWCGVVNRNKEREIAQDYQRKLRIRTPSLMQNVRNLSGGNQQKVVIAKTLAAQSKILIFDEPTRGIDVGARHEIYELMNVLAKEGKTIVMITSDMEELLGMSDRIIVMAEGRLAGEVLKKDFSQTRILSLASSRPL